MDQPKFVSKAFFVIFCAIFFMILAGFIGTRLIDESKLQTEEAIAEAQAEVTKNQTFGLVAGLVVAIVLIVKLKPEQFVHASVILFIGFIFEIAFISIVNYFHLF